ncbi:MAG TPA: glycosyltransferase family 4 protein [Candidatus Acidoferrum sp.]|nr:glycosyltransferase family 4 protein [Candidatus Acidoferrum sp.]
MKVLVLAPPMGATGGIQNYTKTLVRALEQILGAENVCLRAVHAEPRLNSSGELSFSSGVKARFLVASLMKAILWRPQLVICAHVGIAPVGRIIRQVMGAPYWVILYGIEVWGEIGAAKVRALRSAARLVTISQFTFNATNSRNNLSGANVSFLPPSFSIKDEQKAPESGFTEPWIGAPLVLTVGRIVASERYKGHDVMLDAWPAVLKRVPDAIYCIVGDGDDRARLAARARDLNVADSVKFEGAVSGEELRGWYHRCRVFAMPAQTNPDLSPPRGEGFGIVFLEAMAYGKPVVGPNYGAPGEFIRSGEHGLLVNPSDPVEVADALVELLENKEHAEQMGRAARAWVSQEFSEERFRQRLADILKTDAATRGETI